MVDGNNLIAFAVDEQISISKDITIQVLQEVVINDFLSNINQTLESQAIELSWDVKFAEKIMLLPNSLDDKTNAYYRRLLVLDINRTIPEEQKDSQLKEKMRQEPDYAIHMTMLALKQLYADNHFVESDHSKECIANLYRSADRVKAFTDDMLCRKVGEK